MINKSNSVAISFWSILIFLVSVFFIRILTGGVLFQFFPGRYALAFSILFFLLLQQRLVLKGEALKFIFICTASAWGVAHLCALVLKISNLVIWTNFFAALGPLLFGLIVRRIHLRHIGFVIPVLMFSYLLNSGFNVATQDLTSQDVLRVMRGDPAENTMHVKVSDAFAEIVAYFAWLVCVKFQKIDDQLKA